MVGRSETHRGHMTPYGDIKIWLNIGPGNGLEPANGLLPDGTKSLPDPTLYCSTY